ncbi:phosphotriesterase [Euzebyella marina]|uniref:Phosphotriesterase n=1 Tax=Euzebyella marina TaxID=1761453 RepID=A0A3G2L5W1_9FLAO|nr:phosphotriesterase [Euzebyella marina]AYN67655.1 phosphotriesterase [Euzebyella marina]
MSGSFLRLFKYPLCFVVLYLGYFPVSYSQIMTVQGKIDSESMGTVLPHEHVMVDWVGADQTGNHRWSVNEVVARALPFLQEVKQKGVTTFIDCTPAYLGRDPLVLKKLSELSGLQIMTNTGFYGAGENKYVPKKVLEASEDSIAGVWIHEFFEGIDSTGIKPGFIKISVDANTQLSSFHQKLVAAAALTHLQTGLTIVSHTGSDEAAGQQIDILKKMEAPTSAFVWAHAQNGTMEGNLDIVGQGGWISLDGVNADGENGKKNIDFYVQRLLVLKERKFLDHVLISQDAGWYTVGEENGGSFRGYTDIFEVLLPELKKNGFTPEELHLLMKVNPARAFSLKPVKY